MNKYNSHGPTWELDDDGSFVLPNDQDTLGWVAYEWIHENLVTPEGPTAGEPLTFTNEQIRLLLHLLEVEPGTERFAHPSAAIVRIKGAGKDLIAAALCLFALCGPCRPKRMPDGSLAGVAPRSPWVIIAAVTITQTSNTSGYFSAMLPKRTLLKYGIDLGKEITYTAKGGKLQSVTSNPSAMEGARPTFQVLNETGLWKENNNGHKMSAVMERNAAKDANCQSVQLSNAFEQGADSVLEQTWREYERVTTGRAKNTGLMYDSLSAPADTDISDEESLRRGIDIARGDAYWVSLDRQMQLAQSLRTSISDIFRFVLNIPAAADDALLDEAQWDACRQSVKLNPGDKITLGLDVSLKDDSSVLVAVRVSDRAAFILAYQEKPVGADKNWQVDVGVFDHAIEKAFADYLVVAWYSDLHPLETYISNWDLQYGDKLVHKASKFSAIAQDMRTRQEYFTKGNERLLAGVLDRDLKHDGDLLLRSHALNAHRKMNRHGVSFGKASKYSPHKVDAWAALLLADMARYDFVVSGKDIEEEHEVTVFRRR